MRDGHVAGWDDPRMPTIAGLRRRGVPPEAIRDFIKRIGVAKANSLVDVGMFEFSVREVLNKSSLRRMAVLKPLKVVIENYPEGQVEELDAVNHPDDPAAGSRKIKFGRELFIEQDDFMENPPKKFFRLSPGTEVRLRYAYFITCREVVKNAAGEVVELRCTYDPATKGGNAPDGRKVKATIHWVSAAASDCRGGAAVQSVVREARSERGRGLYRRSQPELVARCSPALVSSRRWPKPSWKCRCNSSATAISASTRIQIPASSCSTAPLVCATPGRRKKRPPEAFDAGPLPHAPQGEGVSVHNRSPRHNLWLRYPEIGL